MNKEQIVRAGERFILLLEVIDFQNAMFTRLLRGNALNQYNILLGHMKKFRNFLHQNQHPDAAEFIDNRASLYWEIIDQTDKADDPRKVLAIIQAYNQGLIATSDNLDQPVNEIGFEELVNKKQEIQEDFNHIGRL